MRSLSVTVGLSFCAAAIWTGALGCNDVSVNEPDASIDAVILPEPDACVINQPDSCESCNEACPGLFFDTAHVGCDNYTCDFSCAGINYDANNDPADGCEVFDFPADNHTIGDSLFVGEFTCAQGNSNPDIDGMIISDARVHTSPAIPNFDTATGSTDDWYELKALGGTFCDNHIDLTLRVAGESDLDCYRLTTYSVRGNNDRIFTCDTNAEGVCRIDENGGVLGGVYSGNTFINIQVSKTCGTDVTGVATYTVTGHL